MSERIEELLAEFWARRDEGERLTPSKFLREHADCAEMLRPALEELLGASAMMPTGDLPTEIGGYFVEGRLGHGAAGEVFAVVDGDARPLALKRLLPHIGAVVRAQQRLQREAAVLRELHHPNIVEVVDVGEDGGTPFVVMERIDGEPLSSLVAAAREQEPAQRFASLAGPGDRWQRIARCVASLASAVAAAHERGVLHRDLKPGNVLVRRDGTPVLVDFGLAADADAATLTGTGDVLGTPHYMAPEQACGRIADASSDIYGIGAILYELSTLHPPRHGPDPMQVLIAARSELPPQPRRLDPAVPRELDLIARRAMAFRPRHRYASAAQFASALQLVADGGRPVGLTLGFATRLDEFSRRRKKPLIAALATIMVFALLWFVIDSRRATRAERLREAVIAAVECHLDGDEPGVAAHAGTMAAGGEHALAEWLLHGDGVATEDAFVAALAEGHRLMESNAEAAVAQLQRAVALRPDASVAVAWLGLAAIRGKQHEVAERELASAVRALPNSVRLRIDFGFLLSDRKKFAESAAQLEHAVTLPRADAETWHELAKRHSQHKDYEPAERAIDKAMAMKGKFDVLMLRTKAAILDGEKRHAEAVPLFEQVLAVLPSRSAWTSYGMALDSLHRLREAADAYRQALEMDPKHAPALMNLAYLYSGSNREGCQQCRAFFEANPDALDAALVDRYAVGLLEAEEGNFTNAESVARCVRRSGGGAAFAAAIEQRLHQDLQAAPLGRLLRARNVLIKK